jgi:hypothetical protein
MIAFHDLRQGRLLHVDIRTQREWCETGIEKPDYPLDIRTAQFAQRLITLSNVNKADDIPLISASGDRSAVLVENA